MKKLTTLLWIILLGAILSACSGLTGNNPKAPAPESGKANVVGRVLDEATGEPLGQVMVRLAEVYRRPEDPDNGAFLIDERSSPFAYTDAEGYFVLVNVKPREYLLIIGDDLLNEDHYEIIPGPDGKPKSYIPEMDQTLDVGDVRVTLSQYQP